MASPLRRWLSLSGRARVKQKSKAGRRTRHEGSEVQRGKEPQANVDSAKPDTAAVVACAHIWLLIGWGDLSCCLHCLHRFLPLMSPPGSGRYSFIAPCSFKQQSFLIQSIQLMTHTRHTRHRSTSIYIRRTAYILTRSQLHESHNQIANSNAYAVVVST